MKKILFSALLGAFSLPGLFAAEGELMTLSNDHMEDIIANKEGRLDKFAAQSYMWKRMAEKKFLQMSDELGVSENELRTSVPYLVMRKPVSLKVAQAVADYVKEAQGKLAIDELGDLLLYIKKYVYEQFFHTTPKFFDLMPAQAKKPQRSGFGLAQSRASILYNDFIKTFKQFAGERPGSNIAGDAAQFGQLVIMGLKGLLLYSLSIQPELFNKVSQVTNALELRNPELQAEQEALSKATAQNEEKRQLGVSSSFPAKTTEGTVGAGGMGYKGPQAAKQEEKLAEEKLALAHK